MKKNETNPLNSKFHLYCIEFWGKETIPTKIEVSPFIPSEIKEAINKHMNSWGISIEYKGLDNPELFAKMYFERQSYKVIKCSAIQGNNTELNELVKLHNLPAKLIEVAHMPGVPDFFCFKSKNDWFFMEIKSWIDGYRIDQLLWLFTNRIKTKIIFVDIEYNTEEKEEKEKRKLIDIGKY